MLTPITSGGAIAQAEFAIAFTQCPLVTISFAEVRLSRKELQPCASAAGHQVLYTFFIRRVVVDMLRDSNLDGNSG